MSLIQSRLHFPGWRVAFHRVCGGLLAVLLGWVLPGQPVSLAQTAVPPAVQPELLIQSGHSDWVLSLAFSPDGRWLATAGRDNMVKLWDVTRTQLLANLKGHAFPVTSVAFSPDSTKLATGSWDRTIRVWEAATGRVLLTLKGHAAPIWAVAFSPDGRWVASASEDRSVRLWDAATGKVATQLDGHRAEVLAVAFSPDGTLVASGSRDNTAIIWDTASGQQKTTLQGHTGAVASVAFSPDGRKIATGSEDGTGKLWDAVAGQAERTFQGHTGAVASVAFSPDGRKIATGSHDQTVRLWDAASGQLLATHKGHGGPVSSLGFSRDGKLLATASFDQTVKLWGVTSGDELATLKSNAFTVRAVAFTADGKRFVSGAEDGLLKVWDAASGKQVAALKGHSDIVWAITVSPDGKRVASGSADKTVRLWDLATNKPVATLPGHQTLITSVAFSPDGRLLASAGADKVINLWDAASGRLLAGLPGGGTVVAFSTDGRSLVAGSGSYFDGTPDPAVRVWDVPQGETQPAASPRSTLTGHTDGVWAVAAAADGRRWATGGADKTAKLWDAASGQAVAVLQGHAGPISTLAFSPDGKRLASGGWDNTVRLWDTSSGQPLQVLKGHYSRVAATAFSTDGKRLASGSEDGTIRMWNGETGAELFTLVPLEQSEWVVFTPDGRFDTSLNGSRYVTWKIGTGVQGFEQYKEQYYVPDLWTFQWSGQPIPITRKDIRQVAPPPEVAILSPKDGAEVETDQLLVVAQVKDAGGGVAQIRCYQQGKLINHEGQRGVVAKARKDTKECQVRLQPGVNEITVTAFNGDNIESKPAKVTVRRKPAIGGRGSPGSPAAQDQPDPEFWLLAVGINRYKNQEMSLKYARVDAEAIVQATPERAKTVMKQTHVKTLYDDEVTRPNIQAALAWLKDSKPQDTVVIYVAGHGVTVEEKYYFIPHDLTEVTPEALAAVGVSDDVWREGLLAIPALQMFIAVDTCQSGGLMGATLASLQKRALSLMGKTAGVYVLAASTDKQSALEDNKLGHGAFTYTLLKGIGGEAKDRKGRVTALDLLNYVQEEVPNLTEELFKVRQEPVASGTGRNFPLGTAP